MKNLESRGIDHFKRSIRLDSSFSTVLKFDLAGRTGIFPTTGYGTSGKSDKGIARTKKNLIGTIPQDSLTLLESIVFMSNTYGHQTLNIIVVAVQ